MPDKRTYDYAIVRIVPRVERGECMNAGIILACDVARYLKARIQLDEAVLVAMDPQADLPTIRDALAVIPAICDGGVNAGPIGKLSVRERFHWLVAPRSTIVQTSPVHTGRCGDLDAALDHLLEQMVKRR